MLLPQPRTIVWGTGTSNVAEPQISIGRFGKPQGYRLVIRPEAIQILAGDRAGAAYAHTTLSQLKRWYGPELPVMTIEDWPDILVRGVMLDISRGKIPTLETLRGIIERLADLKINHVELYMEQAFAFKDYSSVWRDFDPILHSELVELDRFCQGLNVELTPNQNCLGHMAKWLVRDQFRPLAYRPEGWKGEGGRTGPPSTLNPDNPDSLTFVDGLLKDLLPSFTSRRVHVGLDQPFDMNPDLVMERYSRLASHAAEWDVWSLPPHALKSFVGYIDRLSQLDVLRDRELLIWGDVFAAHPEAIDRLPANVVICEWGYDAVHPFGQRGVTLHDKGRPFWLCPGTSSSESILGRSTESLLNLRAAADASIAWRANGYLNTDWGDYGHLQYWPISEPPIAYGAAVSWCLESNRDIDLNCAVDFHVFDDPAGQLTASIRGLGDCHLGITPFLQGVTVVTVPLYYPERFEELMSTERPEEEALSKPGLREAERRIDDSVDRLKLARPRRADGELIIDELVTSADLVKMLIADASERLDSGGSLETVPAQRLRDLRVRANSVIEQHRSHWLSRNRPGGLQESLGWLERLRDAYDAASR